MEETRITVAEDETRVTWVVEATRVTIVNWHRETRMEWWMTPG